MEDKEVGGKGRLLISMLIVTRNILGLVHCPEISSPDVLYIRSEIGAKSSVYLAFLGMNTTFPKCLLSVDG